MNLINYTKDNLKNILLLLGENLLTNNNKTQLINIINSCNSSKNKDNIIEYMDKSVKDLKLICKNLGLPCSKPKSELVKMILDPTEYKNNNNRKNNGKIENMRLDNLINNLNNLLDEPSNTIWNWNLPISVTDIKNFSKKGGRQSFDIYINLNDGTTYSIECKGFKCKKKYIENSKPWEYSSPQLVNLPCTFSCTYIACEVWYNKYIPKLKTYFDLPEIPPYDEWIKNDAKVGSAKTEFGKQLKELYTTNPECKEKIRQLSDEWLYDFWKIIYSSDELKNKLITDIQIEMQRALNNKDFWLNVNYENESVIEYKSNDNLHFSVTPSKILIESINIELYEDCKNKPLAKMKYYLSDKEENIQNSELHNGEARLRWGNTTGISNIRWNIK